MPLDKDFKKEIMKSVTAVKVVTTSEIAEELKVSWNTAEKHLLELTLDNRCTMCYHSRYLEVLMTERTTEYVAKRVGVSFYDETLRVVDDVNEQMSFRNFSMAVRYIIHDWVKLRAAAELEQSASEYPIGLA